MKSGAKIYLKLLASDDLPKRIHKLKNGSLRSLLVRLNNPHSEPPCEKRDLIHGLALVESSDRFVKEPRKIL